MRWRGDPQNVPTDRAVMPRPALTDTAPSSRRLSLKTRTPDIVFGLVVGCPMAGHDSRARGAGPGPTQKSLQSPTAEMPMRDPWGSARDVQGGIRLTGRVECASQSGSAPARATGSCRGNREPLISDATAGFVEQYWRKLDDAIRSDNDRRFEYFGLRTVYDRYLLRHPTARLAIETPQYWLLRVACGLSRTPSEAIGFYQLMAATGPACERWFEFPSVSLLIAHRGCVTLRVHPTTRRVRGGTHTIPTWAVRAELALR
jgi:hypothetical protein